MSLLLRIAGFGFCVLALSIPAEAAVKTQLYRLHDHPDGNQNPPPYGLRLDELHNVSGSHDVFTFEFDHAMSSMFLLHSDSGTAVETDDTIKIFGTVFGGLTSGSVYAGSHVGKWEVSFTYTANFLKTGGDGSDTEISPDSVNNSGYIKAISVSSVSDGTTFGLWDKSDGNFSFRMNNDDPAGGALIPHRMANHMTKTPSWSGGQTYQQLMPMLFSGWGWVNHTNPRVHINASDWLFLAVKEGPQQQEIPEPASILMWAVGSMLCLAIGHRRRRRAAA